MTGYESKRAAAQDKLDSMEREALKLALEALEWCEPDYYENPKGLKKWADVMPILRAALSQPAQEPWPEEPFGHMAGGVQPPQRPWVGLTAEEAAECWTTSATQTWKNFEAKLKEKNNG